MKRTTTSHRKRWFFARAMHRAYREMLEKTRKDRSGTKNAKAATQRPLFAEALEPRVLFSGTPAPVEEVNDADQNQDAAQTAEILDAEAADAVAVTDATADGIPGAGFADGLDLGELEEAEVERLAKEAVARWEASGLTEEQSAALAEIEYVIDDLGGNTLGYVDGMTVYLDDDGAGQDWFIDDTEWLDEEFVEIDGLFRAALGEDGDSRIDAGQGVDLLSVIMHEQGHIVGLLDDSSGIDGVDIMDGLFDEGERRMIAEDRAEGAVAGSLEGEHLATSVGVDTTAGANWRTNAQLDIDGNSEYGSDGYIIYGIDEPNNVYRTSYAYNQDQEKLPTYITGITPPASPLWSGNNSNFGQIEDPANGNTLTNTPLLANGGDTFTIQRTSGSAFRLTVLVASGDGNNVTFTTAVDDGVNSQTQVGPAHTSNGLHYHVYDIEAGSGDIVVTITTTTGYKATGFAFDSIVDPADDDYSTSNPITEDETLDIAASGVLANDSANAHILDPQSVTSTNGASVTINQDGSFSYDPSVSPTIQALDAGEMLTDTFTYTVNKAYVATNFEGATLDSGVSLDVPNAGVANITFDAANDELDFSSPGNTNMWAARADAPIAWTARPAVSAGETWVVETEVQLNNYGQGAQQTGITFYADTDGSKPDFVFALDNWATNNRHIHLQGLQDNNPNVSSAVWTADSVILRVEVTEGGATDTYNFFYKETASDDWTQLGGAFTSNFDNSRAGLFYKTGANNLDGAVFSSFNVIGPDTDTATASIKVNGLEDAVDDDYSTSDAITEYETLTIPDGGSDLFANDPPANPILISHDSTSANGAEITVNADGSFTYDPSNSVAIQALDDGDMLTDTFTYSIANSGYLATNFEGAELDSRVSLDVPNAGVANITFDAANDELDFSSPGNTNMWAARADAPIAWTARPAVSAGETWVVETEVRLNNYGQGAQQTGITFYADTDGSKPDFVFALDNWATNNRHIHLQGLQDNNPNVSSAVWTADSVILRVEVTEGGATDTYNFFYKETASDDWTQLGGAFTSNFDNSRAGLFYKTGANNLDGAAFSSFSTYGLTSEIANLAGDYQSGTAGQTSDDVGINASGGVGTWHYHSDTDGDATNGGRVLLTHQSVGLEGGDGYGGTGSVFNNCCGPMPVVSDDGLFDGVTTPPAGMVTFHPGGTSGSSVPPEYSVAEFRANQELNALRLVYEINNSNAGGDGVDFTIATSSGDVLATGTSDGVSTGVTAIDVPDMASGDSIYVYIGNGNGDDPGGDQTFVYLSIQELDSDTATVTVKVNGADDAVDDDYSTSNPITEDEILTIPNGTTDVLANDNTDGSITIDVVGDGSGYEDIGLRDFRSTNVEKIFDADGNNEYGTEGVFFFGDGSGPTGNGKPWAAGNLTSVGATWVTAYAPGANFASISEQTGYGPYDNPTSSGATVTDWPMNAIAVATGGGVGNWAELMTFTIDDTAPEKFRIGIMSGTQPTGDGRWDPTGLRLSVDGGTATEITGLENTAGSTPGWVFFDVDLNGKTSGTFSIEGQNRLAGQGTAISGVTFDVPENPITVLDSDTTSALGAAVTVNPDGSFTYDPTGSATLQELDDGDMELDTFTYSIANSGYLNTNFNELSLDTRVSLDIPNAGLGNITFDAANDELNFSATGNTDMWTSRNNAPIAWTLRPDVSAGETWVVETEVRLNNYAQGTQQAGITFYADSDGDKPDLVFALDNWATTNRHIHLQGVGTNNPNISSPVWTADSVMLRVEVTEGGATDTYNFFYRETANDSWTQLAGTVNFSSSIDNSRVGLVYKTHNGSQDGAAFDSFNVIGPDTETATVTIKVNGLNDAPILGPNVEDFTDVSINQVDNDGDLVSFLINGQITDLDDEAVDGIAVTGTVETGGSKFQYSKDGGANWTYVGTVSDASAVLLKLTDRLRLLPDGLTPGDSSLSFRAWDQTDGTLAANYDINTNADASTNGGTTPYSINARTSTVSVANLIEDDENNLIFTATDGTDNDLHVSMSGGNLVIADSKGHAIASGPTDLDGDPADNGAEVAYSGQNLVIDANSNIDKITFGDMSGFDGSITAKGGDGQDEIFYKSVLALTGDHFVNLEGEDINFWVGSSLTTADGDITATAAGGTGNQQGVHLYGADLTTGTGNVTLDGQGGDAGNSNSGVSITNRGSITTGGGNIDIDGQGGGTGTSVSSKGVLIHFGSALTTTGGGAITIDGTAGTGSLQNEGVFILGADLTVADGNMTINGTGSGTLSGDGIVMTGTDLAATGTGNILLSGTSTTTGGSNNQGLQLTNTTIDTSAAAGGTITLSGTGSSASVSNNEGIKLSNVDITSGDGAAIDIDGVGGGSGTGLNNTGVALLSGSTVIAGGAGTVNIDGTAGSGTLMNRGVYITGANSEVKSTSGAITIAGTGAGSLHYNRGIEAGFATIETDGSIMMEGTGAGSGIFNTGIQLTSSTVRSLGGNGVSIIGTSGAGSSLNQGLRVIGSTLTTTGILTLTGTSLGTSGVYNNGIYILGGTLDGGGGSLITGTAGGGLFNQSVYILNVTTSTLGLGNIVPGGGGSDPDDNPLVRFI